MLLFSRRRGTKEGRRNLKITDDQENTARTSMGGRPGIEMQKERTELNLEKVEETMIGIVIDAMIGTVAMTVTEIESMTAPVAMIQGEGIVLDPENAAGARIDTESAAPWLADFGGTPVFLHDSYGALY